MKGVLATTMAALLVSAVPAWAQDGMMGGCYGMGPGMMGGGYGPGYGMGPGMMGSYGQGYGMCPGMMGGYGQGYGMGFGMMGGYGQGYGMGPGMMGGYYGHGGYADLDLSPEQRAQMRAIQRDLMQKRWQLMEQMHAQAETFDDAGAFDEQAARRAYDAMAAARKQMFEAQLDARKRMTAVLTDEQRARLRGGGRMPAR